VSGGERHATLDKVMRSLAAREVPLETALRVCFIENEELRAEPHVARLLLRRLVGPLKMWDAADAGVEWEVDPKTELCPFAACGDGWSGDGSAITSPERARRWSSSVMTF
jgi:hypothetical protein